MTITIPTWVLWTLGVSVTVPLLLSLLALAWMGFMFIRAMARTPWR